jgi:hypothetical protein
MPMATTQKPTMIPAKATPLPVCAPSDRSICERATKPKMIPRMEGIPRKKMPPMAQINEAMAIPLFLGPIGVT